MFRGLVFGVFLGFVLVSRRMGFCWEVVFGVLVFVFCFGLCARGVGVFGAVRVFCGVQELDGLDADARKITEKRRGLFVDEFSIVVALYFVIDFHYLFRGEMVHLLIGDLTSEEM